MLAIALGLGASLAWGLADFMGGLLTRRRALVGVVCVSQATGLVLTALLVGAFGGVAPGMRELLPAFGAGLSGVALAAFYRQTRASASRRRWVY